MHKDFMAPWACELEACSGGKVKVTIFPGIIIVTVAELGLITPLIGINLFIIRGVAGDVPAASIMRGVAPFLAAATIRLIILIALPQLALWLPGRAF